MTLLVKGVAIAEVPGFGNALPSQIRSISANSSVLAEVVLEPQRSYECTVLAEFAGDALSTQFVDQSNAPLDISANRIRQIGTVTPSLGDSASLADNRLSIQPVSPLSTFTKIKITNLLNQTLSTKTICTETTLYGGYNTYLGQMSFIELLNISNAPLNARVKGFNFDGGTPFDRDVMIQPNARVDVDVHITTGPDKYGTITITHDGPYGSLVGHLSTYHEKDGKLVGGTSVLLKPRPNSL